MFSVVNKEVAQADAGVLGSDGSKTDMQNYYS